MCGAGALAREVSSAGEDAGATVLGTREIEIAFRGYGQVYFLSFIEDEGCWYLLAPMLTGVRRIPVYVDAPAFERFVIPEAEGHKIQN